MTPDIIAEIKKLKRLVQYKDSPEASLEKTAQKNVILRDLITSGNFIDDKEKNQAKTCFEKYLDTCDFESYSDLSTLSMLVFNEVIISRLQKTINDSTTKDGKTYISDKLLKALHDSENQVLSLKTKLGIDKEKKEDDFTSLQLLKKRFHQHIQENKFEFTLTVPYTCSACNKDDVKLVLLRKRVKDFDVMNHPFFSGRFYYNEEIIKDVEKGIISNKQAARYLQTSTEYIDWCIKNKGKIIIK